MVNKGLKGKHFGCKLKVVQSDGVLCILFYESSKVSHEVIFSFEEDNEVLHFRTWFQLIITHFFAIVLYNPFQKSKHFIIQAAFECNLHFNQQLWEEMCFSQRNPTYLT